MDERLMLLQQPLSARLGTNRRKALRLALVALLTLWVVIALSSGSAPADNQLVKVFVVEDSAQGQAALSLVCGDVNGAHWRWRANSDGPVDIPVLGMRLIAPA